MMEQLELPLGKSVEVMADELLERQRNCRGSAIYGRDTLIKDIEYFGKIGWSCCELIGDPHYSYILLYGVDVSGCGRRGHPILNKLKVELRRRGWNS